MSDGDMTEGSGPGVSSSYLPASSTQGDPSSTSGSQAPASSLVAGIAGSSGKGSRKKERQHELQAQMRQLQREIDSLNDQALERRATIRPPPGAGGAATLDTGVQGPQADVQDVLEQLRRAQDQVSFLQQQQQSPWALGLTDEPPPNYEDSARGNTGTVAVPDVGADSGLGNTRDTAASAVGSDEVEQGDRPRPVGDHKTRR